MQDYIVPTDQNLEEAISRAFRSLAQHDLDSDEYSKTLQQITKLYSLKLPYDSQAKLDSIAVEQEVKLLTEERLSKQMTMEANTPDSKKLWGFSKDQLLSVGGNLAGILVVLHYEQIHVIASKAFGMLGKIKL